MVSLDICATPDFSQRMPSINEDHDVDDVHANHNDHDEGLWENIPTHRTCIKVMYCLFSIFVANSFI